VGPNETVAWKHREEYPVADLENVRDLRNSDVEPNRFDALKIFDIFAFWEIVIFDVTEKVNVLSKVDVLKNYFEEENLFDCVNLRLERNSSELLRKV
jgi:hypothetical protein